MGVYVLLDTSGEPLRRGLAGRPDLIKPNTDELAGLTGFSEPARAARDARRREARAVAASPGAEGMLAVTEDSRLAGGGAGPADREPDRRRGLRGGRAAVRPCGRASVAGAAGPGGRAVRGHGGGTGSRGVRPGRIVRGAAEGASPGRYFLTWPCLSQT